MHVFLSWSGDRSRYVAEQFDEWLPVVIQSVDTFMSDHDIDAGSRWSRQIDDRLEATDFGVLFVTPENQKEPWLVHEAGALGKSVEESRVVPVTIEMQPADVDWPLARFQGVGLEEDEIQELVESVNSALGEDQLEQSVLERAFETNWPSLQEDLRDIPPPPEEKLSPEADSPEEAQRRRDEKLDEMLELVRSMARTNESDLLKEIAHHLKKLTAPATSSPNEILGSRPIDDFLSGEESSSGDLANSTNPLYHLLGPNFQQPKIRLEELNSPFDSLEATAVLVRHLQSDSRISDASFSENEQGDLRLKVFYDPELSEAEFTQLLRSEAEEIQTSTEE